MLRRFKRETLERALLDPELLNRLVEDSAGYVLVRMRQEGLMPALVDLMAHPCAASVSFIIDHYELDQVQRVKLSPLFQRETGNERLAGGTWDESRIERALLNTEPLPLATVIPLRLLLELPVQVEAQKIFGDYEFAKILTRSVKLLTVDEFMSLDPPLLAANHDLFESCASHYTHPKFKALSQAMGELGQADLNAYRSWPFELQDRDFLFKLLREKDGGHTKISWDDVEKLNGADNLINRIDFFRQFNSTHIDMLADVDVEAHKAEIQDAWFAVASAESYSRPAYIINCKSSVSHFEKVFDVSLAKRLLELNRFVNDMGSIWQDDHDSQRKLIIMKRAFTEVAAADPEMILAQGGLSDFARFFQNVLEYSDGNMFFPSDDEKKNYELKTYDYAKRMTHVFLPLAMSTLDANFSDLKRIVNTWSTPNLLPFLKEWVLEHPSVNALWALGQAYKSGSTMNGATLYQRDVNAQLFEMCQAVAACVDSSAAHMVLKDTGVPYTGVLKRLAHAVARVMPRNKEESSKSLDNFLDVDYQHFADFSLTLQMLLAHVDDRFMSRMKAAKGEPSESFLMTLLNQSSTDFTSTLAQVVALNPQKAMSMPKFASKLKSYRDVAKIVNVNQWMQEIPWSVVETSLTCLADATRLWKEAICALPASSKPIIDDEYEYEECENDMSKKGSQPVDSVRVAIANLEVKATEAGLSLKSILSEVPHHVVSTGLELVLDAGRFADAAHLIQAGLLASQNFAERFRDKLHLMARGSLKALIGSITGKGVNAEALHSLITQAVSYDGRSSWELDTGSCAGNHQLAEALMPLFGEHPLKALFLFSKNVAPDFSNDFAVKRFPELVFYQYDLAPRIHQDEQRGALLINKPYSNAQVIKLWDHMESHGGFFSHTDVNASYSHFISANFENDPQRYMECRELAKSRPKLYCILADARIEEACMRQMMDQEKFEDDSIGHSAPHLDRDELRSKFSRRWTDWAVVQEGMSQIFDEMSYRDDDNRFSRKLANKVIDQVVWSTYADLKDAQGNKRRESLLSEDQSHAMLAMICARAPLRAYELTQLGTFKSIGARFISHGGLYFNEDAIERFVFPPAAHEKECSDLRRGLAGDAKGIGLALTLWILSENRVEDAKFLDWWLREDLFRREELVDHYAVTPSNMWYYHGGVIDFVLKDPEVSAVLKSAFDRMSLLEATVSTGSRRRKLSVRL